MSLQLRLFGGGNKDSQLATSNDGGHAIDKSKVLAATAPGVITPQNPGNFSSIRSIPVVAAPRYFDREEADRIKELAKDKTDGAKQSKRAYAALTKIEEADKSVHKSHRKYEGAVAENELKKNVMMLVWIKSCTVYVLFMPVYDWVSTRLKAMYGLGLMQLKLS